MTGPQTARQEAREAYLESVAEDRADEGRNGEVDDWTYDRRQDAYEHTHLGWDR